MLASRWKKKKILKGGVVGTLMSNLGLEIFFKKNKIKFLRADVGDRFVKEKMQKNRFNLGGEQSGHIILGKFATTGDGLLVALEILFSMRKGKKASELFYNFTPTPQVLKNITVRDKNIINSEKCKKAINTSIKFVPGTILSKITVIVSFSLRFAPNRNANKRLSFLQQLTRLNPISLNLL